jgi:ribosomal-protein-alanine N-acetyltransferase
MIEIETKQLKLLALDIESLSLLRQDRILLEKHLDIEFTDHQLSLETKNEIEKELIYKLSDLQEHTEEYQWYTSWEIILVSRNQSIGSIGFTGIPDEEGTTGISYFIDERFRKMGYATEAMSAMINWAFMNKQVHRIVAETHFQNYPSIKLLTKCGFCEYKTDMDLICWEYVRT